MAPQAVVGGATNDSLNCYQFSEVTIRKRQHDQKLLWNLCCSHQWNNTVF